MHTQSPLTRLPSANAPSHITCPCVWLAWGALCVCVYIYIYGDTANEHLRGGPHRGGAVRRDLPRDQVLLAQQRGAVGVLTTPTRSRMGTYLRACVYLHQEKDTTKLSSTFPLQLSLLSR